MHKRFLETGAILVLLLCLSLTSYQIQEKRINVSDSTSIDSEQTNSEESPDVSISENGDSVQSGQHLSGDADSSEDTEEVNSTEGTDATEDTDSTEVIGSTEDSDSTEDADSTEVIDSTEDTDSAKDSDSTEITDSTENEDTDSNSTTIESEPCEGTRYVSTYALNVRSAPSTDAEIIGTLYLNEEVELISKNQTKFYEIKHGNLVGYAHGDYLSEEKVAIKAETPISPDGTDYSTITDLQERVAAIAKNNHGTMPCTGGYCARWVSGIYQAAGLGYPGGNAIDFWTRWESSGSTSSDNIPVGAVIVGSGSGSEAGNKYGHVGIYLGNGMVADNVGRHRIISLEDWMQSQVGTCNGYHGYIGWVWPYGEPLGDTTY